MTNQGAKSGAIPEPTEEVTQPGYRRSGWPGWRHGRRQKLLLLGGVAGLVLVGWWSLQKPHWESLASAVPVSAIGYLEMESGTSLLQSMMALKAWPGLSAGAIEREWEPLTGWRRWLLRWLRRESREWVGLLDSRAALVLTALEWKGEMVRPHWTLILTSPSGKLGRFVLSASDEAEGGWIPPLAARVLGPIDDRRTIHAGVEIVGYHSQGRPELALYVARIDDLWMLSNQRSGLQSCLDAHLGRAPRLREDFYWQQAQARIAPQGAPPPYLSGYVSADGAARLLQSGIHLLTAPLEAESGTDAASASMMRRGLVGLLGETVTSIAPRLLQGVAFAERGGEGWARTRTLVQLKQDLVEQLSPALRSVEVPRQQLAHVPAEVVDWTVFEVADPLATLGAVEAAISARIGIAESFLLHQALLEAREILLDPRAGSPSTTNGVVAMTLGETPPERVWLLSAEETGGLSSRLLLPEVAGRPATLLWRELRWRGSAPVLRALTPRGEGETGSVIATPRWQRTPRLVDPLPGSPFLVRHYFGEEAERDRLQATLHLLSKAEGAPPPQRSKSELPWAVRGAALVPEGLLLEAQSSFGSFPLLWEVLTMLAEALSSPDESAAAPSSLSGEEESPGDEARRHPHTG